MTLTELPTLRIDKSIASDADDMTLHNHITQDFLKSAGFSLLDPNRLSDVKSKIAKMFFAFPEPRSKGTPVLMVSCADESIDADALSRAVLRAMSSPDTPTPLAVIVSRFEMSLVTNIENAGRGPLRVISSISILEDGQGREAETRKIMKIFLASMEMGHGDLRQEIIESLYGESLRTAVSDMIMNPSSTILEALTGDVLLDDAKPSEDFMNGLKSAFQAEIQALPGRIVRASMAGAIDMASNPENIFPERKCIKSASQAKPEKTVHLKSEKKDPSPKGMTPEENNEGLLLLNQICVDILGDDRLKMKVLGSYTAYTTDGNARNTLVRLARRKTGYAMSLSLEDGGFAQHILDDVQDIFIHKDAILDRLKEMSGLKGQAQGAPVTGEDSPEQEEITSGSNESISEPEGAPGEKDAIPEEGTPVAELCENEDQEQASSEQMSDVPDESDVTSSNVDTGQSDEDVRDLEVENDVTDSDDAKEEGDGESTQATSEGETDKSASLSSEVSSGYPEEDDFDAMLEDIVGTLDEEVRQKEEA